MHGDDEHGLGGGVGDTVGRCVVGVRVGDLVGCVGAPDVGAMVGIVGIPVGANVWHLPHVFRQLATNSGVRLSLQFATLFAALFIACTVEQKPA